MNSKDQEIRQVAAELDDLLDSLRDNVTALNAILTRPAPPPDGDDEQERLVAP